MSASVEHERVRNEATQRGPGAFLLTVTGDGRPHVVAITADWEGGAVVTQTGRTSTANATARPGVALLWPPDAPGGYSLIVDGEATVEDTAEDTAGGEAGSRLVVQPTRAVLHRPVPPPDPASGCESDCVALLR